MTHRLPIVLLSVLVLITGAYAWGGEANVFVYHRFGEERLPSTNIGLEVFAGQLELLSSGGYTVLPLGEVVRRLKSGEELPDRCAVLTVDDAYESFLTGAMPLLRRYGFPATLFVATDFVGHPGYLDWDQLKALAAEGVEIGNHSGTHLHLVNRLPGESAEAWRRRVRADLDGAQAALEARIGVKPRLLAYPYGEFSPELVALAREAGFSGATGQQSGVIAAGVDLFTLPRFPMGGPYATIESFADKLAMRALPVKILAPLSPIVSDGDPPELVIQIAAGAADLERLRCFVPGQEDAVITPDPRVSGRYVIRAHQPLEGRRSKYTLTAPGLKGQGWFWFSQPWINPEQPEP